ncbi:MAG: nuclear transport factor 2 family protein [Cytophagales bacterium]|nr:nuclear transport factor 2 family protein [Bernardetiaceae bacterium]MDW8211117.1 nuclear transport factor 2 family protein [Cytophagales bacterium]
MNPVVAANQAFYQAIIEKRVADICASYVPSEDTYVILEGPRYTTLGYEKIAKGWADFCASPLWLKSIEWVEGPFCQIEGCMAWLAGIILLTVQVHERDFTVKFRATFVMRQNQQGRWQIQHEHVSAPLNDPYGIGDWLKK